MTYYFYCSICGQSRCAYHTYYDRYIKKYNCRTDEELSERYICRNCKRERKKNSAIKQKYSHFVRSPMVQPVQELLQIEVDKLKAAGLTNQVAVDMFKMNVKNMFDKVNITNYHLVVENGVLKGIMLKNIPFYNDVLIELKG